MSYVINVLLSIWTMFCGYCLYGWFALPIGAPAIGFIHFFGLWLLLEMLTSGITVSAAAGAANSSALQKVPDEWRAAVISAARATLSTISLGFGYVAHFFI